MILFNPFFLSLLAILSIFYGLLTEYKSKYFNCLIYSAFLYFISPVVVIYVFTTVFIQFFYFRYKKNNVFIGFSFMFFWLFQLLFFKYMFTDIATSIYKILGLSYFFLRNIQLTLMRLRNENFQFDFLSLLEYFLFPPILFAGPIMAFSSFNLSSYNYKLIDYEYAFKRITIGLIKHVLILGYFVEPIFDVFFSSSSLVQLTRLEAYCFLLLNLFNTWMQISAIADIVIGISHLMGKKIPEDSDFPLSANNIVSFWKKWHISLSQWCHDNVYLIVLGATRNSLIAVLLSFIFMGLWHYLSLNWFFWGIWHGLGILIYARVISRLNIIIPNWISVLMTVFYVALGYVFILTGEFSDAIFMFARLLWLN